MVKKIHKEKVPLIIQIIIIIGIIWLASIVLRVILPLVIVLGVLYLIWKFWGNKR